MALCLGIAFGRGRVGLGFAALAWFAFFSLAFATLVRALFPFALTSAFGTLAFALLPFALPQTFAFFSLAFAGAFTIAFRAFTFAAFALRASLALHTADFLHNTLGHVGHPRGAEMLGGGAEVLDAAHRFAGAGSKASHDRPRFALQGRGLLGFAGFPSLADLPPQIGQPLADLGGSLGRTASLALHHRSDFLFQAFGLIGAAGLAQFLNPAFHLLQTFPRLGRGTGPPFRTFAATYSLQFFPKLPELGLAFLGRSLVARFAELAEFAL